MWNIVDHYRELAWRYRKPVLCILAVAILGTAALSIVQLITKPVYLASSSILMMPAFDLLQKSARLRNHRWYSQNERQSGK